MPLKRDTCCRTGTILYLQSVYWKSGGFDGANRYSLEAISKWISALCVLIKYFGLLQYKISFLSLACGLILHSTGFSWKKKNTIYLWETFLWQYNRDQFLFFWKMVQFSASVQFSFMLGFIYKMLNSPLKSFESGTLPLFLVHSLKLYGDKLCWFFPLSFTSISPNAHDTPVINCAHRVMH